jgi:hypothetical protein
MADLIGHHTTTLWVTSFIIEGAGSGEPKRRHDVNFPMLTYRRGKYRIHFYRGFIQNKTLSNTGVLQIYHTKNR